MDAQEMARRIAELPLAQRALLFAQLQQRHEAPPRPAIPRASRAPGLFPLSFAQQRLWFLSQYDPESPEYNIPQGFRVTGPLAPEILERTLTAIVSRHEALRTTFTAVDGEPRQLIAERSRVELPLTDLTAWPRQEREARARQAAVADARRPFDLTQGPLLRALLFRLDAEEHLFFVNVHHIVYDGWSRGIFLAELAALYQALAAGRPSPLPELPVQYLDFALWQRGWLAGDVLARQLEYWRQRLAGAPPLDLITDRPRPALRTHDGAACSVLLPRPLAAALTGLAQEEGGTLFVGLASLFKALLHVYTGQEDLTLGTLIANRTRPELEGMIGFFANTLALRTDLAGDPSWRQLLRREREVALGAYAHQDLPFEKLVDEISPQRDLARTPIFEALLILLNAPGRPLEIPGLAIAQLAIDNATARFDLTLYMVEAEEGLTGYLEYNAGLYDAVTVRRFLAHLRALAEAAAATPDLPLSALSWLSPAEARQLLVDWNATGAPVPRGGVHELIAEQAARTPEAVAVVCGPEKLSYAELDRRADLLARHLRGLGVGPEVLVGLAVERSFEMMVGLLGILKAGGAYVPLDPDYPRERLAYMLDSSRLPVLLTQERLIPRLPAVTAVRPSGADVQPAVPGVESSGPGAQPAVTGVQIIALDRDWPAIAAIGAATAAAPPAARVEPQNLAYVIYTSGSTGRPKGVEISHGAVVNFLAAMARTPGLAPSDVLPAVTTLSFDIAGLELYLPLICGARVVLVPREVAQAGEELLACVQGSGATFMQATPATWRLLLGAGWKGGGKLKVLCGGEALPRDLADQILEEAAELWNVYGPTEATIWSMLQRIEPGARITLGRPLANTQVYLLTPHLRPVPAGVPGELLLGGSGLARGYRGRPDLTAERFVPDPFGAAPGARLYRTGDLARHLPDGTVEYLGRIDHQVKVRGFRIELGEIEAVLGQHPGIAQTVVLAREDVPGTRRLVAYLTPRTAGAAAPAGGALDGRDVVGGAAAGAGGGVGGGAGAAAAAGPSSQELREFLQERLPEYMVPALFVTLAAMPLTPNGKIDRRALPAPTHERAAADHPYVAPSGAVETALAALWSEVLGVAQVGADDDFFALGGDSLLVIRVVSKANKGGLGITTKQLFQHRTVAQLAKVAGTAHILAEQGAVEGLIPFTPAQLHFLELRHVNPRFHSLGAILAAKGESAFGVGVGAAAARRAFRAVVAQHDNLRVRLIEDESGQRLVADASWPDPPLPCGDFSALPEEAWKKELNVVLGALVRSLDLARGPLFKGFFAVRGGVRTLILVGHFFTADVASWQILLDDFDVAYRQAAAGEPIRLQAKSTSARQWADRLAERAHSMDMKPEREYWFSGARRLVPPLPLDFPAGENSMASSQSVRIELSVEETRALLQDAQRAYGVQIDAFLLTSVLLAFVPWTGSRQLLIDLLGHGREALYDDVDLTRTVGWFNTIYPAYLEIGDPADPGAAVKSVNEQLRRIPNGGLGYGILRYLSRDQDFLAQARSMPQPGIFFNFFGDDHSQELAALTKSAGFGGYGLDRRTRRLRPLAVGVYIQNDQMLIRWERSTNIHRLETVQALADRSAAALRWFAANYPSEQG
jgi:amino acid adenylation domain-containing protein/non-ribosomal peptide synthase protein (TIGR01720 family)